MIENRRFITQNDATLVLIACIHIIYIMYVILFDFDSSFSKTIFWYNYPSINLCKCFCSQRIRARLFVNSALYKCILYYYYYYYYWHGIRTRRYEQLISYTLGLVLVYDLVLCIILEGLYSLFSYYDHGY